MRIYVLMDNDAKSGFAAEHGFSLLLELDTGHHWLWDAGQSDGCVRNAAALGLDLGGVAGVALSHGHYDHTGGLPAVRAAGAPDKLFAHPEVRRRCFAAPPGGPLREISAPPAAAALLQNLHPVTGLATLDEGLYMLTDIPRADGRFQAVEHFYRDADCTTPDTVPDDGCLVAMTRAGPVLVLGCCHSGLANTMDCAARLLGLARFRAVVGGLHLMNAGAEAVEETGETMLRYGVEEIFAGHCTGRDALRRLQRRAGAKVRGLAAGCTLEWPARR